MTTATKKYFDNSQKRGPIRKNKKGEVIGGGPTPAAPGHRRPVPAPSSHALARQGQPYLLNNLTKWRARMRARRAAANRIRNGGQK